MRKLKHILGLLIGGFVGFILSIGDIAHFYEWQFYAIIVPFILVLFIYGAIKEKEADDAN